MDGDTATLEPMPDAPANGSQPEEFDSAGLPSRSAEIDSAAGDSQPTDAADSAEIEPLRVVEAILFSTDTPLPPAKIASILGFGTAREIRAYVKQLNDEYAGRRSAFRVEEIAGGLQMLTLPAYNRWLGKLLKTRQETKLSPAALETLSIIAYKQPCTRADVEAVRGVACGEVVNRLREMDLIKIVGRAEDLGRPMLYGTTRRFLEVFGLPSLKDLPEVEALRKPAGQTIHTGHREAAGDATRPAQQAPRVSEEETNRTPLNSVQALSGQNDTADQPAPGTQVPLDAERPPLHIAHFDNDEDEAGEEVDEADAGSSVDLGDDQLLDESSLPEENDKAR